MCRFVAFVAVIALVGLVPAVAECKAFRELNWGDPVKALGDATHEGDMQGCPVYTKTGDDFVVGGIRVQRILYWFFKGRLMGIMLQVDADRVGNLRVIADMRFGTPAIEQDGAALCRDYETLCQVTKQGDSGIMQISSEKISSEWEDSWEERLKKEL